MINIIQQTIICTIPLLIVALAGVFAEKSGIINLALEGEMIFGGFIGAVIVTILMNHDLLTDKPQLMFLIALLVSGIAGALLSLLLSFAAIKMKADQTIAGTALNTLAPAIVCAFGLAIFNKERLSMPKSTNYAIKTQSTNFLVQIFADKAYLSTYVCIALFIILSIWLNKSKIGMHLRACGEHPQAAASVGINVIAMRYLGTSISGFLAGIGGYSYFATIAGGTAESTIGGMGFLALAIMIFGNWSSLGIALGSIMFGFLRCLGAISTTIPWLNDIGLPLYFYNMLPFIAVLIVLVATRKRSNCPKAEGIPYEKGQR